MSTKDRPADGKITSGRGVGNYVYCFTDRYPIKLEYDRLVVKDLTIISRPGFYTSYGEYLFNEPDESKKFFSFTPQTVARIDILASTSTGPSASNFVKGTLIGGVALGAAAAMAPMGSTHTVKVTWRDDTDSKESIITFNNSTGFQNFIGKLGTLMNQPDESSPRLSSPAISSPAISSADEILKFKKLMDEGIITQAEFDAKKKQLLGIENVVINSSETKNPEYYSVMLTSYNDRKMAVTMLYMQYKQYSMNVAKRIIDSADLPFEILGTPSKPDAEEVAKKFDKAGATVEIRQPKSDGGYVVIPFKDANQQPQSGLSPTQQLIRERAAAAKAQVAARRAKEEVLANEKDLAKLNNLKEGGKLFFGSHNGQRLSWKVLKIQGRKALIITENNVCNMPYHELGGTNITWSECTLREWLNNDFYNGDFTQALQERILPCTLNNDDNPKYKSLGGPPTTDKVFLLSINEAKTLFANGSARANGYHWWLRSPCDDPKDAAFVRFNGEICLEGGWGVAATNAVGVRPALWVDLTSEKERKEAEEKAERIRREKEESKKRFDDYWEAHSDERKELEAEQTALKEQINNLNASLNEQAAALKKDIAAIPGKEEIDSLDAEIKKLSNDIAALGIFKGREKMALQGQIVQAEADKKTIQEKMSAARAALEANSSAIKRDTLRKISQLQSRINDISTELNKPR